MRTVERVNLTTNIVLISGKQGAGKTTLQNAIAEHWQLVKHRVAIKINFADALYDMHNFCLGYIADHGIKRDIVKDGPLLQLLGTEWGRRTVDENIWVNIVKAKIALLEKRAEGLGQAPIFLVGDCRFPNEVSNFPGALRVRLQCAKAVRKYRCSQWRSNDTHESETALDNFYDWDFIFNTEAKPVAECVHLVMKGLLEQKPKGPVKENFAIDNANALRSEYGIDKD